MFSLERHLGITSFVTCHSERTDNELMAIMKKSADGIIEIWTDDYQYVQVMKSPNGVVSKPMIMEATDYSTVVTLL
ncbi:hypothetical protein Q73_03175 [Bacillus coahuilensis m2-6]|nr:hypothetical protein Q73_03175 [Bacillus coahuilensis m2-6]